MTQNKSFTITNKSRIEIHLRDCMDGMAELPDGSVSVVVTSPPYNLGIKYSCYDDTIPRDEYLKWIHRWAGEITRILAGDGSLFINLGSSPRDPWIAIDVACRIRDHLILQNTFHWIKSISIDAENIQRYIPGVATVSMGHYKPINSPRFVNDCHEYIFHFTKSGEVSLDRTAIGVPYQDKSNIRRWKHAGSDLRCRGNTWFIPYQTIMSRSKERPHPATFPEKLVENCLKVHGLANIQRVMDPFMGLGTTARVCAEMQMDCIGFELDPEYFDESCRRLKSDTSNRIPGL